MSQSTVGFLIAKEHILPLGLSAKNPQFSLGHGEKNDVSLPPFSDISEKQCTFRLLDDIASELDPRMVVLYDHSHTGTFVNGNIIGEGKSRTLQDNDIIRFGSGGNGSFMFTFINKLPADDAFVYATYLFYIQIALATILCAYLIVAAWIGAR